MVELFDEPNIAAGPHEHSLSSLLGSGDGRQGRLVVVLRDAHRYLWARYETERLLQESPDAIVVETGLPAWRPPAGAYVAPSVTTTTMLPTTYYGAPVATASIVPVESLPTY